MHFGGFGGRSLPFLFVFTSFGWFEFGGGAPPVVTFALRRTLSARGAAVAAGRAGTSERLGAEEEPELLRSPCWGPGLELEPPETWCRCDRWKHCTTSGFYASRGPSRRTPWGSLYL